MLTKQRFKRKNPINWEETNCVICGFWLPTAVSNFPCAKNAKFPTFLDFVIEKEHFFIRNIFDPEELSSSKNIETFENMIHHFE